jgi:hypothetical protein
MAKRQDMHFIRLPPFSGIEKAPEVLIPKGLLSRMLRFPGVVVDLSLRPMQTASGVPEFFHAFTPYSITYFPTDI